MFYLLTNLIHKSLKINIIGYFMANKTIDNLPIVTEKTFEEFIKKYPIASEENDPEITERIKKENPQIYRILQIGMQQAPNRAARSYYECGMQICYELLRRQSAFLKK